MSDDEFYDDEYADFHDMLYDADPDPDLADDLAEHSAHSPVWFDNPNEEAREYFSDWEYYSDDYFDDDPALLRAATMAQGDVGSQSRQKRQPVKRGRKRKLSEARESLALDTNEMGALAACMRGTVWKTTSPEPTQNYKKGLAEPVALRLSKAIMRSAYSTKQGFGKGRLKRDESWANELSLADMGLRTEKSIDVQHGPSNAEGDEGMDDMYEDEEDTDVAMEEQDMDLHDVQDATGLSFEELANFKSTSDQYRRDGLVAGSDEEQPSSRKRRKILASESSTETKNTPNTPETSYSSDVIETKAEPGTDGNPPKEPSGRGKGRVKGKSPRAHEKGTQVISSEALIAPTRKRRISDVEISATASTTSARAKKVAKNNTVNSEEANASAGIVASKKTRTLRGTTLRNGQGGGSTKK